MPEGVAFVAYPTQIENSFPIYRFYDPNLGVHLFTSDENKVTSLRENTTQYNYEGIAYYVVSI